MAWLNYHHLLYFWTVARLGTIAAASKELHLSQPTISTQLKTLEEALGHKLFQRAGRKLKLTDVGRTTFRYADEIFRLGGELTQAVTRGPMAQQVRFSVGVADVIPKLVAQKLLEPAFEAVPQLQLEVHEGPLPQLLGSLAVHELDVVLADAPAGPDARVRAFSHLLGESSMSVFAKAEVAAALRKGFPGSLEGAAVLVPGNGTQLRRQLDAWFTKQGLRPQVVGEFADTALLKMFGKAGRGAFFGPTVIEEAITRMYDVVPFGRLDEVRERFYAISVERRLRHPAVVAVAESARRDLFSG